MTTDPRRPRIFSHLTKTRFFHIEDALIEGKLRFFIGSFERGHGANNTAYAFLDFDDARVIMNDLAWGKPVKFVDPKGGKDSTGAVIARVLKIERTHAPARSAGEEDRVWVEVVNGPGEEIYGGIVKLRGDPFAEISIPLGIHESRKMAFAALDYLRGWDVYRWIRGDLSCDACSIKLYRGTGVVR